jgi:hypothetical protein
LRWNLPLWDVNGVKDMTEFSLILTLGTQNFTLKGLLKETLTKPHLEQE